ncbi:hypothetical protein EHV15_01395 [Paenibacillus oralis]|uniref:Uncharacterized protein n=1 Tax=Paenibacillus oralis TaxID=2490856 RepID=A0A3P3TWZ5_9BACL|nr:hypothetical protein [Paenibacillus oralis]RRJ61778.1 hypothetical protein EHV15_01395 [Paenibacillus oralis]
MKSYDTPSEISSGLEELEQIKKEVPSLSGYANQKYDELNSKLKMFQAVSGAIRYILIDHTVELEDEMSPANSTVILMNEYEDVQKTISALEKLSSDLNSHIIEIEAIEEKDNSINGLYEAMTENKKCLDSKINYLKKNSAKITSSNSLLTEDNIFALLDSTDIISDVEAIDSQIETSLSDLKQRAKSLNDLY